MLVMVVQLEIYELIPKSEILFQLNKKLEDTFRIDSV